MRLTRDAERLSRGDCPGIGGWGEHHSDRSFRSELAAAFVGVGRFEAEGNAGGVCDRRDDQVHSPRIRTHGSELPPWPRFLKGAA